MADNAKLATTLQNHLKNADSAWSMGSFGALAEFMWDQTENLTIDDPGLLTKATKRGGIKLSLEDIEQAYAYETTVKNPKRWSGGLALCLRPKKAVMNQRSVLTELGSDHDAIHNQDKAGMFFDIGLGAVGTGCGHVDFCIRTSDSALIGLLRENAGKNVFDPASPVMLAILKVHPHRIAITKIGRIEVYQPIGGPDTGGKSPEGPHTHILPKLIKANRTHSANILLPNNLIPCAYLHPASPFNVLDADDEEFNRKNFQAFQVLLKLWGSPKHVQTKQDIWDCLKAGKDPKKIVPAPTREHRKAIEVANRQARVGAQNGLWGTARQTRNCKDNC